MLTESALKYYAYSGNAAVMQLAINVATWHLDHGMTKSTDSWPSVPHSEGPFGTLNYAGANQADGVETWSLIRSVNWVMPGCSSISIPAMYVSATRLFRMRRCFVASKVRTGTIFTITLAFPRQWSNRSSGGRLLRRCDRPDPAL